MCTGSLTPVRMGYHETYWTPRAHGVLDPRAHGVGENHWTPRAHGVLDPRVHGVVFFLWTHRAHGADLARAHGVLWAEMSTRPSTLYLSFFALELLMILCIFVIYPRVLIPNTICILLQLVFPHVVEPYDHLLLGLCFNLPYLTACAIYYLLE